MVFALSPIQITYAGITPAYLPGLAKTPPAADALQKPVAFTKKCNKSTTECKSIPK
jgi:hypothetical protein